MQAPSRPPLQHKTVEMQSETYIEGCVTSVSLAFGASLLPAPLAQVLTNHSMCARAATLGKVLIVPGKVAPANTAQKFYVLHRSTRCAVQLKDHRVTTSACLKKVVSGILTGYLQ